MYLIVGLGNPGREYAHTRHNMGFLTTELFADKHGICINKSAHRANVGEGRIGNERVVIAQPQTFMNDSGRSVVDLMNWYKCDRDRLIVIYDDVDLPEGEIRVRARGSAGTHNGMKSIIYLLGYDDFPRIRVGIGSPQGQRDMIAHVLGVPPEENQKILLSGIKQAAEAIELIISDADGINSAQARFNKKAKARKEPTAAPETDIKEP